MFLVTGSTDSVKRFLHNVKNNQSGAEDFNSKASNLQVFNYSSIRATTNDFSSENKLGEGGYGPVYKVTFDNASIV